jgi:nicotinate-nucleotide adenylyltransferase
MTLVLLGGTFDPPHIGHLLLAECAKHELGASMVTFLPAGDPWLKRAEREKDPGLSDTPSPSAHRLQMLRLALGDERSFAIDDRETRRSGPTYTADTLAELWAEGHRELTLILGADAVSALAAWHEPERVLELARVAVTGKASGPEAARTAIRALGDRFEASGARFVVIETMPPLAVSSTLIRDRVRNGLPVRYLVPEAVWQYIEREGLYRTGDAISPPRG